MGLFTEYDDSITRAQHPKAREWRTRMGWPRSAAIQGIGGGVARINPHGTLYEPSPEGTLHAIIIPCWDGPAPGQPEDIADLLAWVPSTGQTFTRRGVADVLGAEAIRQSEPCMGATRPLVIYSNPGAWARGHTWDNAGDHGVVILNWLRVRATLGHLVGVVEFIAPDINTGRKLRDALQPKNVAAPRIMVAPEEVAA